jgi:flagellar motor switch protein FliN/FliY
MEVTCAEGSERPGSAPQAENWFRVELALGDLSVSLLAAIGEPLLALVGGRNSGAGAGAHAPEPPQPADVPDSRMLELLLDVELPVSVSFGRTQLALKETLKLTTGSIVELNRAISEPVEVVVNNCVIARGEVVVIEGNYGVRIKEIMSRQDRIRHLR